MSYREQIERMDRIHQLNALFKQAVYQADMNKEAGLGSFLGKVVAPFAGKNLWLGLGKGAIGLAIFAAFGVIEQIVAGSYTAKDDINYFRERFQYYMHDYAKSDPTYSKHKELFDRIIPECATVIGSYDTMDKIHEELDAILKSGDTTNLRTKLEKVRTDIEKHQNDISKLTEDISSVSSILVATRDWGGVALDALTSSVIPVDWIPQITTYAHSLERTANDLYGKLEGHNEIAKTAHEKVVGAISKIPATETATAAPASEPASTSLTPNATPAQTPTPSQPVAYNSFADVSVPSIGA
jgi:hypothetical protein